MPMGPSCFIVRSCTVPRAWVPGLGWCCLCSIRAWQNNGEERKEVLTQAHVGTANWSPAGAGFAPFRSKCEHFITTALRQFGTGKDFLGKFPWSYRLHDGEDFVPRVGWCRLMHNNFSDHDALDELGESEKQFKIRALQKLLQNCCQLRRNTGLILLAVLLLSGASFCHFKPLVCHLASRDFTIMKMKVYSTNDDVCGGKWGGCVVRTTWEELSAKSRLLWNFACRDYLLPLYLKQWQV